MYRNEMRDRFNPGTNLTAVATAAVLGKTFAAYSGPMQEGNIAVATASAAATAGVVKYNANAGELVGVARGSGRVVTVIAGAALTAGSAVEVGTDGTAIPASSGVVVGWLGCR